MRVLRVSLVGTITLALLGGAGSTVGGEGTEAPALEQPSEVTGQILNPRTKRNWDATWDAERQVEESRLYSEQRVEVDDPRLSGWLERTWNVVTYGGPRHNGLGEVMTGTAQLVNDDGSWIGTERGYVTDSPRWHYWQFELTGTGAYEGYSALLWTQGSSSGPMEANGFIFPGSLPEYPPEPEVIIDPIEVVVAQWDAVPGYPVRVMLSNVSASEVDPDVLTELRDVKGRRAAVDILAGTPITPDLLEPLDE